MNPENYYIPRKHRLLSQSPNQPLSNFERWKRWNISNFEGWDLTLVACKKEVYVSLNLVCRVVSAVYRFIRFFLILFDLLAFIFFFLSYRKTILKMSSVSGTFSYFSVMFQCSFINSKWRRFSTPTNTLRGFHVVRL